MQKTLRFFFLAITVGSAIVSCDDTDENNQKPEIKTVVLKFEPVFKQNTLNDSTYLTDAFNRAVQLETFTYYISSIQFHNNNQKTQVSEVALVDHFPNPLTGSFSNKVTVQSTVGSYTGVSFDLGLPATLNGIDPATYNSENPLSAIHGMWWDWATKYIFTKTEGRIDSDSDGVPDQSWFVHTGMEELFRPGIYIDREFSVSSNDTVTIYVELDKLFNHLEESSDLVQNGQSHTTDNMDLARDFSNRISASFF